MVKNILLNGRREYVKFSKALAACGTEIYSTAPYTTQEHERAERMNSTLTNGNWTFMIHVVALEVSAQSASMVFAVLTTGWLLQGAERRLKSC